jgi:hypothetical protein
MKLLSISPSESKTKKYKAVFDVDGKTKTVQFGAKGYEDYTTLDKDVRLARRELYLARHYKEDWTDPLKAGTLSRFILWERPNLQEAIRSFRARFHV